MKIDTQKRATPQVQSNCVTQQAVVEREVQQLVLEPRLCVFRLAHCVRFPDPNCPPSLSARYEGHVQEGLATPSELKQYLQGKTTTLKTLSELTLAPQGFRELAQQEGYVAACERFGSEMHEAGLFEKFSSGQAHVEDLLALDHASHMLFDRQGEVLPTAIFFDYMNGNLRDGAYHLERVLEVLAQDPRVRAWDERAARGRQGAASPATLTVSAVPYYNVSRGCSRHVAFVFSPSEQDMKRLWAQMKSYGGSYPSTEAHRAIFDLDMLGLRQAGAAKHANYWGSEDSSGRSDSDED